MEMFKAFRVVEYDSRLCSVASLPTDWLTYYTQGVATRAKGNSYFYCFSSLGDAVWFVSSDWLGNTVECRVWRIEAEGVHRATRSILHIQHLCKNYAPARERSKLFGTYWQDPCAWLPALILTKPPGDTQLAKVVTPIECVWNWPEKEVK